MQPIHIKAIVNRCRRLSFAELAYRARVRWRTDVQRAATLVRGNSWDRAAIVDVIVPGVLGPETDAAIENAEWSAVEKRLRHLLGQRPARFVLDPSSAPALRDAIFERWPDAPSRAAAAADDVCAGRFSLLGFERLSFDSGSGRTDWQWDPVHRRRMPARFWADVPFLDPRCGDHKVIWELNRHQFLFQLGRAWWLTGDRRYRNAMLAYVRSWLDANPPLVGINWASMLEIAFRSISWIAAIHFLLADITIDEADQRDLWLLDMCVGLDRQLTHVEQNLSYYYSPNTHLTGEALALYVAGVALPEFTRSARWLDIGRRILLTEVDRQIAPDGGHAERSTHYHRYTLDFYALALLTAERAGDVEAIAVFSDAVARLERFMRAVADDTGRMPLIGDDDGGMLWTIGNRDPRDVSDALALAQVLLNRQDTDGDVPEEVLWLAWSMRSPSLQARRSSPSFKPGAALHPSRARLWSPVQGSAFPATGFVTARNQRGDHLVFDAGPHGFLNGGHAHADALALTLTLDSRPLLIDPGTATYTMDHSLRDRMRATESHNTLTLDGRASAVPAGPFKWATRADARLTTWRHNAGFVWAEGRHDAFAGAGHRRTIIFSAVGACLVIDDLVAQGAHSATTHWHFDPSWRVTCDGARRVCATSEDRTAWLLTDHGTLSLLAGDDEGVGWCSPRYGVLVPTSTAHVTHTGDGSFSMITWLGAAGSQPPPRLEPVPVEGDASSKVIAVRVHHDHRATVTVVRPGDTPVDAARWCDTTDYHTDARFLQYCRDESGLVAISVADATIALAHDERLLSVRAEASIVDLHALYHDGCLDLHSSSPPTCLFVWGEAATRVTTLRLNGGEREARYDSADGSLVVASADWQDRTRVRPLLRRATDVPRVRELEPATVGAWIPE